MPNRFRTWLVGLLGVPLWDGVIKAWAVVGSLIGIGTIVVWMLEPEQAVYAQVTAIAAIGGSVGLLVSLLTDWSRWALFSAAFPPEQRVRVRIARVERLSVQDTLRVTLEAENLSPFPTDVAAGGQVDVAVRAVLGERTDEALSQGIAIPAALTARARGAATAELAPIMLRKVYARDRSIWGYVTVKGHIVVSCNGKQAAVPVEIIDSPQAYISIEVR